MTHTDATTVLLHEALYAARIGLTRGATVEFTFYVKRDRACITAVWRRDLAGRV